MRRSCRFTSDKYITLFLQYTAQPSLLLYFSLATVVQVALVFFWSLARRPPRIPIELFDKAEVNHARHSQKSESEAVPSICSKCMPHDRKIARVAEVFITTVKHL